MAIEIHTNLTWFDAALALIIGIIGSLVAAYLFSRVLGWLTKTSTAWAERSRSSAQARISKFNRELAQIEAFKADTTRFVGWTAMMIARGIAAAMLAIFVCVGAAAMQTIYSTEKLTAKIDPTYVWNEANANFTVVFALGVATGCFVFAMTRLTKLVQYSNLDRRKKLIEEQIAQLSSRWGL
jgi:hypothetical protein